VNVIRSYAGSQKIPIAMLTDFAEGTEDGGAAGLIQPVGTLVHLFAFRGATVRTGFRKRASKDIMLPVYDAGFVAVQMRPIACESDEVTHSGAPLPLLYSRGSAVPSA
jgi:hypothetical protein